MSDAPDWFQQYMDWWESRTPEQREAFWVQNAAVALKYELGESVTPPSGQHWLQWATAHRERTVDPDGS